MTIAWSARAAQAGYERVFANRSLACRSRWTGLRSRPRAGGSERWPAYVPPEGAGGVWVDDPRLRAEAQIGPLEEVPIAIIVRKASRSDRPAIARFIEDAYGRACAVQGDAALDLAVHR